MIDPQLAAGVRPADLGIDTPLQAATGQQQYTNLRNVGQLQQQQIQQQDVALKTHAALNQAIQASTRTNSDGTVSIDHDAVQKSMTQAGFGAAGHEWGEQQKKADLELQGMSADQLMKQAALHKSVYQALSSVRGLPEAQRQAAWDQQSQWAYQQGLATPGSLPRQVPDDQTLAIWESLGMDSYQRATVALRKQEVQVAGDREKDYADIAAADKKKADAYSEWMMNRKQGGTWRQGKIANGHQYNYNDETNEQKDMGPVDLEPKGAGRGGAGGGVTPTQQDRDAQAALKRANDAEKEESKWDGISRTLGNAVQNGDFYIDAKGNPVAWQKQIPRNKNEEDDDYQIRIEKEKPKWIAQMRQRVEDAQQAANRATANKNNAMNEYATRTQNEGARPQVSTEQAIGARGGKGAQDGQGGSVAPEGTIIRNAQGQRQKKINGRWVPLP